MRDGERSEVCCYLKQTTEEKEGESFFGLRKEEKENRRSGGGDGIRKGQDFGVIYEDGTDGFEFGRPLLSTRKEPLR